MNGWPELNNKIARILCACLSKDEFEDFTSYIESCADEPRLLNNFIDELGGANLIK